MKRLASTRQRLAVVVIAIALLGAGGWATFAARSTPKAAAPRTVPDDPAWRAKVEHALPVVEPPTTAAWRDGYRHYIVTVGKPTKTASAAGPDGASGRWVRVSAPGQIANLDNPQGRALLPWIRSFVTDAAGATWVRLADNAPAALDADQRRGLQPELHERDRGAAGPAPHDGVVHRWPALGRAHEGKSRGR